MYSSSLYLETPLKKGYQMAQWSQCFPTSQFSPSSVAKGMKYANHSQIQKGGLGIDILE
jgi:hypothetical protein